MKNHGSVLAFALFALVCELGHAALLDDWRLRNPLPTASDLSGVAYGSGRFVALGNYGDILTSGDGLEWSADLQPTNAFYRIASGGGIFVATGYQGISSSSDGLIWTQRFFSFFSEPNNLAYVNGRFIGGGSRGLILMSFDGVNWTDVSAEAVFGDLTSVAYGNGLYIAVGNDRFDPEAAPLPVILTSPDATNWTSQSTGALPPFRLITFGNGIFVASSLNGGFFYSTNAVTWTEVVVPVQYRPRDLTFAGGLFFAVGDSNTIFSSTNGQDWALRNMGNTSSFSGLAVGAGKFVAVGTAGAITVSSDSVNWAAVNKGFSARLFNCTWANGQFVAVGGRESGGFLTGAVLMTSSNGLNWQTQEFTNTGYLAGIACGAGTCVAAGSRGALFLSSDAVSWTFLDIAQPGWDFTDVTYGGGQFVAVATGFREGGIFTSTDGTNWTQRFSGADEGLYGVTYANGRYMAVGGNILVAADPSTILTSNDGVTWTHQTSGVSSRLTGVTYGNGLFVGVLYDSSSTTNTIVTSPDGIIWTQRSTGVAEHFNGVAFGEDTFVAVGIGAIYTSTNGINWTRRRRNTLQALWGAAYGNGTFLAVGEAGTILQTDPLCPVITNEPRDLNSLPCLLGSTFSVGASGTPPLQFQWYYNGSPILDATNESYTAGPSSSYHGEYFAVVEREGCGAVTSRVAQLYESRDNVPPSLKSAIVLPDREHVLLTFWPCPMNPGPVIEIGNYAISDGALISNAVLQNDTNILLTTSLLESSTHYILEIANQSDVVGNIIVPDPTYASLWSPPLRLALSYTNGAACLTWPTGGILQHSLNVTGIWMDVIGPSKSLAMSNTSSGFYRVRFP